MRDTHGCGPGACGTGYGRRYLTKAEKTELLSDYAQQLENELAAVKERLQEMQKEA